MDTNKKLAIITIFSIIVLVLAGLMVRHFVDEHQTNIKSSLPTTTATIGGQQFELEVATTQAEQNQGLSGRPSLGKNDGMLFVFDAPGIQYFWMINMEFPIDLIWINGDKIVGFEQNMPTPATLNSTSTGDLPIYTSPGLVDKVIEINSGEVASLGLKIGDTVQMNLGSY
jgi:uncharacterized membrane protein (UPF0127 family)